MGFVQNTVCLREDYQVDGRGYVGFGKRSRWRTRESSVDIMRLSREFKKQRAPLRLPHPSANWLFTVNVPTDFATAKRKGFQGNTINEGELS